MGECPTFRRPIPQNMVSSGRVGYSRFCCSALAFWIRIFRTDISMVRSGQQSQFAGRHHFVLPSLLVVICNACYPVMRSPCFPKRPPFCSTSIPARGASFAALVPIGAYAPGGGSPVWPDGTTHRPARVLASGFRSALPGAGPDGCIPAYWRGAGPPGCMPLEAAAGSGFAC